jgi:hypothetical protein
MRRPDIATYVVAVDPETGTAARWRGGIYVEFFASESEAVESTGTAVPFDVANVWDYSAGRPIDHPAGDLDRVASVLAAWLVEHAECLECGGVEGEHEEGCESA